MTLRSQLSHVLLTLAGVAFAAASCTSGTPTQPKAVDVSVVTAESGSSMAATPPPGCINGLLSDPKAFFFYKIDRQPGDPAGDFDSVLRAVGWPTGSPAPGVRPQSGPFYGIIAQVSSSGAHRGRLFLPTSSQDSSGFFLRDVSYLTDCSNSLCWDWHESANAPPYAPQACP